ncbi:30S ribosomal protein S5 [Candidatus Jorgensenbacteria bacterium RIFCSPLOWO2_02_FULL_45_12]|uniref:Small ribosomal subunit protein uS5 n=2 Tax=Candidatus Joergenseniibacteriota TaxID=1752739 RepID=A0A1F6BQA6_9BACT|nr:MAG: 30S ribosomal protein S5 [Candidatus Jorgensenbacteria bacterium GW2011_GWA2_45_9]OGG38942.1 MAG: 30S ribosomal protein S5 [Candidatus Jorgensenbacteria bacterium RIFCSPHIGHO2_02_FULL_45_20]OGG42701.1 MAG: 30S ribosomal protein S5 [Candidatus Jorgensenbacteria bacterium RIFCSPLOWO2_02_FULL_45_12]
MKPFFKQRKSEFDERTLEIRRVTRVVAGGKRFSFRATVVSGDRKGRVGIGMAKGLDVASAVEKAKRQAEKKMIKVELFAGRTLPYDVEAKYSAARVRLKPAREGHGLIAGGSVRAVLELLGVKDVSAKILGRTTNKLTNAMATMEAIKKLKSRAKTSEEREPDAGNAEE